MGALIAARHPETATRFDLEELVDVGGSWHNGHFFHWNLSKFIVEEMVVDEFDRYPPPDYKFSVCGEKILFIWSVEDYPLTLDVDEDFQRSPHASCSRPAPLQMHRKPTCWNELVKTAKHAGRMFNMFLRVDLYASKTGICCDRALFECVRGSWVVS